MKPQMWGAALAATVIAIAPASAANWVDYEVGVQGTETTTNASYPNQMSSTTDWQGRLSFIFDMDTLNSNGQVTLAGIAGEPTALTLSPTSLDTFTGGIEQYHLNLTMAQQPSTTGLFSTDNLAHSLFTYEVNQHLVKQTITGTVVGIDTTFLTTPPAGGARASLTGGAVPEPASWSLMLAGFGAIGGALRRRRRYVPA